MLLVFLILSLLPLASRTQASPILKPGLRAWLIFGYADSNFDDFLHRTEMLIVFSCYDSNNDGRVSRFEYVSYHESAMPGSSALAHYLFDIYDWDDDHMLDAHDYEYFYRLMDLNSNGYVSKAEFIYFWTGVLRSARYLILEISTQGSLVTKAGLLAKRMFDNADFNNDGFLQRFEMWVIFNRYDSNGDGRVSRFEYVSYQESAMPGLSALADYLFDIYDMDNDHMLDAHDYEYFYRLMDLNDSGHVRKAEFIHFWTVVLEFVKHVLPHKH